MIDPLDFARKNIKYSTDKEWPNALGRINYVMRGNGVWSVRTNKIGTFYSHIAKCPISGFPEETQQEGFELALPEIPRRLLTQVLAFFKDLCQSHDFEAYVQFWWNPEEQEYFVNLPLQKVSKGRVIYEPADDIDPSNILVCEIHSHNSMNAFFSGIDDRDEMSRGDRFFGVVGKLNTSSPEIKMSFICGGTKRVDVNIDDLFESDSFPREWLQRISYIDRKANPELYSLEDDDEDEAGDNEANAPTKMSSGSEDVYDHAMNLVRIDDLDDLSRYMLQSGGQNIENDMMDIGASHKRILRNQLDLIGE